MSYLPLAGVRVLEWARERPGPMAGRKLADLGAEVVKLSDAGREQGGDGVLWPVTDRNKLSVRIDFGTEEGRAAIRRLAEVADVVLDGSRPGAFTARTGLDLADLRRRRPSVVVCSITGYGMTGPLSRHPAHAPNLDAMAGIGSAVRGDAGGWAFGARANLSVCVELGYLNGVIAILAALHGARETGQGAWIDLSLFDAAIEGDRRRLDRVLPGQTVQDPRSVDLRDLGAARSAVYTSSDDRAVILMCAEQKFWARFCRSVDREDLVARHADGDAALQAEIQDIVSRRTASEWLALFEEHEIAGSIMLHDREVLEQPQFAARDLLIEADGDRPPALADPIRWADHGGTRPGQDFTVPVLGADTEDVLGRWLVAAPAGGER